MFNDDQYNHMADEHSGAYWHDDDDEQDPYEQYEDYYMDTGYDPYHLFDDLADIPRVTRFLNSIKTTAGKIAVFFFVLLHLAPAADSEDIPF